MLFLVALAAASSAFSAPLRVLILSGQNNHEWRQTTPKLKSILTGSGRFTVEVTEHPEQCNASALAAYDVLLSDWNTFGKPAVTNWPEATRSAFLDFVRQGKGLVVVHAGSSSFYDWPEYQQLVGAWWQLGQTGHGPVHEFTVEPVAGHPVTRGLGAFQTTDELWVRAGKQPKARVLATAAGQPVVFATEFGKGRGFTILLGHNPEAMDVPGFQSLLLRGAEWAATGQVKLPADAGLHSAQEQLLKALAVYRFGDDRKPVLALEKYVAALSTDRGAKEAFARKLAELLTGTCTVEAKQVACSQLSLIGSVAQVPVLAPLVSNRELGFYARLALERIPGSEAERALLAGLRTSSGAVRQGLMTSLAARGSSRAVPEISKALGEADVLTAGVAIDALGRLASKQAAAALLAHEAQIPQGVQARFSAALLHCAQRLLAEGQNARASAILDKLVASKQPSFIRTAAFPAYLQALGKKGPEQLVVALSSEDGAKQAGAIRALRCPQFVSVLPQAATRLQTLPPQLQVQLIELLGERGDAAAIPALTAAAGSTVPAVRQAALAALGLAGNASTVPVLVSQTAASSDEDQRIITESLMRLRGKAVDAAMVTTLKSSQPVQQRLVIRALVLRGASAAVPVLLELAAGSEAVVRGEAIAALGKLGNQATCQRLANLVEREPEGVASAMAEICRREGTEAPMLAALAKAAPAERAVLLEGLASIGSPAALAAVRDALQSDNPTVRVAAVRTLANWPDAAPVGDLSALATSTQDAKCKALALRGIARLVPLARNISPTGAVALLTQALKAGGALNEQKALLAALGEVPGEQSLKAAQAYCSDPSLAAEAKAAVERLQAGRTRMQPQPWTEQIAALFRSPENLCRGAKATNPDGLSPDGQGQGPEAAIDGDPASYWDETDGQKEYALRVQLKQRAAVGCLRILGFQHQRYAPRDFNVLCDGKLVKQVQNAAYQDNLLTLELPATECTTVELRITGYYSLSPAIRELGLFARPPAR